MSLQLTHKVAARTDRKHIILSWGNRLNLVPIIEKKPNQKQLAHEKEMYTCWDSKQMSKTKLNKTAIPSIKFIHRVMR